MMLGKCGCCGCSDNPPDHWLNNPVVTVPNFGGGTADVPAALQPWDYCGYGSTGGCGHPSNWRDFCGNPAGNPDGLSTSPCGTITGPSIIGKNVFTLNSAWKETKRCQHPGWKAVAALPVWPGRYGYVNGPSCCPTGLSPQFKYTEIMRNLTARVSASGTARTRDNTGALDTGTDYTWETSLTSHYNGSVDRFGNRSSNATERSAFKEKTTTFYHPDSTDDYYVLDQINGVDVDIQDECGRDAWMSVDAFTQGAHNYVGSPVDFVNLNLLGANPSVFEAACGQISIKWDYPYGHPASEIFNGTADALNAMKYFDRASEESYPAYFEEVVGSWTKKTWRTAIAIEPLKVLRFADNEIIIKASGSAKKRIEETNSSDGSHNESEDTITWSYEYHVTLGGSITFDSVQADGDDLLATWSLGDPEQYPWRTDDVTWRVPLVRRDAASTSPDGSGLPCPDALVIDSHIVWRGPDPASDTGRGGTTYITGNRASQPRNFIETRYTGVIIGAPQEVGKGRFFNFYQKVVEVCCPDGLITNGTNFFCLSGWGELSPSELPKTATSWTDPELGSWVTPGASNMQYLDSVLMQKWAENLTDWPSVNMARPFGRDRFLLAFASASITDDPNCSGTTGVSPGSYNGDIVTDPGTVGTFQRTLWNNRKYPNCRPIGSTISISAAVQEGIYVKFTTAEKHWLMVGDRIDVYGVAGFGLNEPVSAGGGVPFLTQPGTTTFYIQGTLGAYTSGGYIASAGVTNEQAKLDWTCSRHFFQVNEWTFKLREEPDPYFYAELQQLAPKTGFSVLYCSPNPETFPADCATFSFPFKRITSEVCGKYWSSANIGNRWHANFMQVVADPFFIPPVKCSSDSSGSYFHIVPFCAAAGGEHYVEVNFALVEPWALQPDPGAPYWGLTNCSYPRNQAGTSATFHATYFGTECSVNWKEVTHHKCQATVQRLAEASGYTPPGNDGYTDPLVSSGGAGDGNGGAGDGTGGAGDGAGGGL